MSVIYIVESNTSLREQIVKILQRVNLDMKSFKVFSEATNEMEKTYPTLLLVGDTSDVDRTSITKQIAKDFPTTRILHIVESVDVDRIARHHKLGLDDFIRKPLNSDALISRIHLHLSPQRTEQGQLKVGDLVLDSKSHVVRRGERRIELTPTEFKLLEFLMRNKDVVLERDILLRRVWQFDSEVDTRVVDVNVSSLRDKITQESEAQLLHTVRGFGYKISDK